MTHILDLQPTVFLRHAAVGLEQRLRLGLRHEGAPGGVGVRLSLGGWQREVALGELPVGESWHDLFVPEVRDGDELAVQLVDAGGAGERRVLSVPRARHWSVHVVQLSHHDVGYTSLPSRVFAEQDTWLDQAIEMAGDTRRYPDEARFRLVIEQAWSVEHALRQAPPRRAARLIELLRRGQFELTALYGNLTTELCGHETLVRALYPAFQLRRQYGIPIVSAEHNDIPGFTWGLSEVLAGAGVRLLCPGLPLYYAWGGQNLPSFWDEEAVFGQRQGLPGVFWWESPSGQRILFCSSNGGCGGDCRGTLPALPKRLLELQSQGYPHDVLRWPVGGGARDNSPYIAGYADTIRAWNRTWAWPRLVCSTNARFLADFVGHCDLAALPVRRGDVPGQDYPVGATSTAAATAANRRTHADLPAAEALATAAALHAAHSYPGATIADAWRDVLLHDEHTWGHHLPCGPTCVASELEKAVHAWRGATWAYDVARKAMARLADAIRLDTDDIHLVVFNPLPQERCGLVSTPLREIDNAGSEMVPIPPEHDPAGVGFLRGVILNTRWPVHPPAELVEGHFTLLDVASAAAVPYQILDIDSPLGPELYAAQRLGLGSGSRRYGAFEAPQGIKRTLCFQAGPVPALGYRAYRLLPCAAVPAPVAGVHLSDTVLENRHWRLEVDRQTGFLRSLVGKTDGREWIERNAPHPFGALVVQEPSGAEHLPRCLGVETAWSGPLGATLRSRFAVHGYPQVELTLTLWNDEPRLDVALALLKDPTPLLHASLAFPFALPAGRFTCDTPLCTYDPATDRLPGAFLNRLTVQNWVHVAEGSAGVLWSSLDAPVVSLGRLWPPRVSPAHSCVLPPALDLPPQPAAEPQGGAIYSCVTYNNLGTNFAVSQSGPLLFRYCIRPAAGARSAAVGAAFGAAAVTPLQTMFTCRGRHADHGTLAAMGGFLRISEPAVQMLAFKQAEDGRGLILRLWNPTPAAVRTRVELPGYALRAAESANLAEEPAAGEVGVRDGGAEATLGPAAVVTLRLLPD
jgi:hypothetical protein